MLHGTTVAIPAARETRWERLRGRKAYPLESMPGVEGGNDRMNPLLVDSKACLRAALDTPGARQSSLDDLSDSERSLMLRRQGYSLVPEPI